MSMNNSTLNSNSTEESYGISVPIYESIIIIMVLLFALLANGLLIFLFLRDHRMQTTTNFFVISHIVSEFFASCQGLIISLCVLFQHGKTSFSVELCIFIGCENIFFFNTSFLSLTAIAVNRYLAVVKKVHHKITGRKAKVIIFALWMLALVASLPWGSMLAWKPVSGTRFLSWLVYCKLSPGVFNNIDRASPIVVVRILLALICIGIPILILLVCFYFILKSSLRNRRQVSVSYNIHRAAADAYARSAFTTLLIIAVYLICNAFILPIIISPSIAESKHDSFVCRIFVWLRSATYPMVYILRNPIYFRLLRQKLLQIYNYLVQLCPCRRKDEGTSYTRPKSPALKTAGHRALEINKRRGGDSPASRSSPIPPIPAARQIRAWYVSKPHIITFTDLGVNKQTAK